MRNRRPISDFKTMEQLKEQLDAAVKDVSDAKRYLLRVTRTDRVENGLTLGEIGMSCYILIQFCTLSY